MDFIKSRGNILSDLASIYNGKNSCLYLQKDSTYDKPVIIKLLPSDYPRPSEIINLSNEFEHCQMSVKGVRKAYKLDKINGQLALWLEYIDGIPLKDFFIEKTYKLEDFLRLAIEIARVLGEVHQNHVIHKDINTNNILVNPSTLEVHIIDFGISSKIDSKSSELSNPENLEGTLNYISPEQTGRMNRCLDYRSDLYSLGVTFYYILAQRLPFVADDPMELVHAHIAQEPEKLSSVAPHIPEVLSKIVHLLMQKNAEDRYQSAWGLKYDLEQCLHQLTNTGEILLFNLKQEDYSGKFRLVEKLYGREKEVNTLLNLFEKASQGRKEMMLIGGYSGVGKSMLVHEIHKPITKKKGYFISGKYSKFQKDIPYSAINQAFNEFCDYLLTLDESTLESWRNLIQKTVGDNGKIMTEVIPNLELIIGEQPAVAEVGDQEAQHRFNLLIQNFLKAISTREHPLVLFLDDLQWADMASLHLIKLFMLDNHNQYFLLICAYRDNEVNDSHPFGMMIDNLKKENINPEKILLQNLEEKHVYELIADALQSSLQTIASLGELIYHKTLGNAFFTTQLLKTIHEEDLLNFDFRSKKWVWDIDKIRHQQIADNVVDLMVAKIIKLSEDTQEVLKIASCIGSQFDLRGLSVICQKDKNVTLNCLWEAVLGGLVQSLDENYKLYQHQLSETDNIEVAVLFKFVHDRIQQSTYSLLEEEEKSLIHLRIAQWLLNNTPKENQEEVLFDIVHHFNHSKHLIEDVEEKQSVIQLNLKAGAKAKASTAYQAAVEYYTTSIELLANDSWSTQYNITFEAYKGGALNQFLSGNTEKATELYDIALSKAKNNSHIALIYFLKATQAQIQGQLNESMVLSNYVLEHLNINIPKSTQDISDAFQLEKDKIFHFLEKQSLDTLLQDSRKTSEEDQIITKSLFLQATTNFLLANPQLLGWNVVKMLTHSMKAGQDELSSFACIAFGFLACSSLQDISTGHKFGELGIKLSQKFENKALRCISYQSYVGTINHYQSPVHKGISMARDAVQYGLEGGEMQHAGYSCFQVIQDAIIVGDNLQNTYKEAQNMISILKQINSFILDFSFIPSVYQALLNLLGLTNETDSFDTDAFTEKDFLEKFSQEKNALCTFYMAKLRSLYLFEEYAKALEYTQHYSMIQTILPGLISVPEANFYTSLTLLANYKKASPEEQKNYQKIIHENQEYLKYRAKHAPENFLHKYLLVEAEKANVENRHWEAVNLYEEAIKETEKAEYLNNEALAHKLFAYFWMRQKKKDYVQVHMSKAHYFYKSWGAIAITNYLEKYHRNYIKNYNTPSGMDTTSSTVNTTGMYTGSTTSMGLDLSSVIKASQTISKEVILENLLDKVVQIVVENAGAERCYLIDQVNGELLLMQQSKNGNKQKTYTPIQQASDHLPVSIIQYVKRSKQELVLSNASQDHKHAQDKYIQENQIKSVLCFPVMRKNKLSFILYLENNLTEGAFTSERMMVLKTLSSQMAISIENALLYSNLEKKVQERTLELSDALGALKIKNEQITDSIKYAYRIQKAILPSTRQLKHNFQENFILYRPKDIVSGDFYWYSQTGDYHFVAVVDCTGHGVPGAFMSMIGNTLLNEIVNVKRIFDPAHILEFMHEGIKQALKQEETDNTDGMDICICSIEYKADEEVEVIFGGAKRPLMYIHQNQLEILKGERKAIGGWQNEAERKFNSQKIYLQKGDILYLTSDGYVDSPNQKRKRFSDRRLKELLKNNFALSLPNQKQILEDVLKDFQQGTAQRDDITVLGLKL